MSSNCKFVSYNCDYFLQCDLYFTIVSYWQYDSICLNCDYFFTRWRISQLQLYFLQLRLFLAVMTISRNCNYIMQCNLMVGATLFLTIVPVFIHLQLICFTFATNSHNCISRNCDNISELTSHNCHCCNCISHLRLQIFPVIVILFLAITIICNLTVATIVSHNCVTLTFAVISSNCEYFS